MFKIKNIKIKNITTNNICWLNEITSKIEKILDCQDFEDLKKLDDMLLNEKTINQEFLEKLEKEGKAELTFTSLVAKSVGSVKFLIIKE